MGPERAEQGPEQTADAARAPVGSSHAAAASLLTGTVGPRELLALQRAAGNRAVGRALARAVSPPPLPSASQLQHDLATLDQPVQAVLHRWGHTRVARPSGGWRTYQVAREVIDFDWIALLFVLHDAGTRQALQDYLTVVGRLMVPALQQAARSELGRTPDQLPNLDMIAVGMWIRNPPPALHQAADLQRVYDQLVQAVNTERLLTEAGTRARQANITDLSIPGRRDQDHAFLMGVDAGGRNQFYRQAGNYYRNLLNTQVPGGGRGRRPAPSHVLSVTSLEEVLTWIRNRAESFRRRGEPVAPLGTLYLISHANESGFLDFKITTRGSRGFFSFELEDALSPAGLRHEGRRPWVERLEPLGAGEGVDGFTRIFIRGCDIGRHPRMLTTIARAFGGSAVVHAPREAQYYGPVNADGSGGVGEGLADTYAIEVPARQRFTDEQLAQRLADKYTRLDIDFFRDLVRRSRRPDPRSTIARTDYTTTWGPIYSREFGEGENIPRNEDDRITLMDEAIRLDARLRDLVDAHDCSWGFRNEGRFLVGVGLRRHFGIHVTRRDADGALVRHSLRDRSAYGIDERPVSAAMTAPVWR